MDANDSMSIKRKSVPCNIDTLRKEQLNLIKLEKEKLKLEMEVLHEKKEYLMAKRRRLEFYPMYHSSGQSFANLQ